MCDTRSPSSHAHAPCAWMVKGGEIDGFGQAPGRKPRLGIHAARALLWARGQPWTSWRASDAVGFQAGRGAARQGVVTVRLDVGAVEPAVVRHEVGAAALPSQAEAAAGPHLVVVRLEGVRRVRVVSIDARARAQSAQGIDALRGAGTRAHPRCGAAQWRGARRVAKARELAAEVDRLEARDRLEPGELAGRRRRALGAVLMQRERHVRRDAK
eukprot:scaffold24066_cov37-Phaeocystis_antarctica.AAC.2